jgi:hypothetical protein
MLKMGRLKEKPCEDVVNRICLDIASHSLLCEYYRLTKNNRRLVNNRVRKLTRLFPAASVIAYITTCSGEFRLGYRYIYGKKVFKLKGRQFSITEIVKYRVGRIE